MKKKITLFKLRALPILAELIKTKDKDYFMFLINELRKEIEKL